MEEEEQERMFPEYVVLNEENVWEEPIFTSLSRCSSLTSLGENYSDNLSEEEELTTPHVPKIKSIKLIYIPMKDSGIELDPTHGCATASMAKQTSKKRNRDDQAPYSYNMESNGAEKKRRKNTARKTESVRNYSRKQKKEIPVDQPAQLRKSNALESKAKINPRKRQQSEEAPSSLAIKKRKQSAKQVKEIPTVNDSQTPKSTSPKSKQTPHREDSDPEKRVKKSTAKRQRHC
ncbi:hypothetical protein HMI56_003770 [Coelomomyces lativittatus]|nr:hypothetical protein HMI56_003770 [Coelomomyces lativittatus]